MGPGHELVLLGDHELLAGGVADGVVEARAAARRWARLVEFHRRRESDHRARAAVSPRFTLTPRQETAVEVAELWGLPEGRVRHELNVALFLDQHLPRVWELCLAAGADQHRRAVAGVPDRTQGQARAGVRIETDQTGSFVFVTGAGFAHPLAPTTHPVSEVWPDLPQIQFSGTELLQALTEIRDRRDQELAEARELEWEHATRLEDLNI